MRKQIPPSQDKKNTPETNLTSETDPVANMESLAERYLDLWQDNIQRWTTDPKALEKWITEIKSKTTPNGS